MSWLESRLFPNRYRLKLLASEIYDDLILEARNPWLFTTGGLTDTMDGRFQAFALTCSIALASLVSKGEQGSRLADKVYRKSFDELDASLRETGVGDASIARRVRSIGEHFFGLGKAIQSALKDPDPESAVQEILNRNGIGETTKVPDLSRHLLSLKESFDERVEKMWLPQANK